MHGLRHLERGVVLGLVLLLAGGCSRATQGGESAAGGFAAALVEADGADARAAAMRSHCARRATRAKLGCYEEALLAVLGAAGVAEAMATLDALAEREPDARHFGHVLAHVVGIGAYTSAEEVGAVFAECTPSHQSGCYHGVIQAYFADVQERAGDRGVGALELNRLCSDHRGEDGSRWLLFQCVHGIGHGLVSLHDYHLPRALAGCDLLDDDWERESCYGGAFMENLVNATMPHHAPGAHGNGGHGHAHHQHGHPEHGEHAHGEHEHAEHEHAEHAHGEHAHGEHVHDHTGAGAGAEPFVALDRTDPHHPCSAVGERYLNACYSMQTSAVLFWSGGDIRAGIELCESAPRSVLHTCYVSLGRDINAYTRQRHDAAVEKCLRVREPFQPSCLVGVAKNLIDVTADASDGIAFCHAVGAGWNRERCFQAVGEQVAMLEREPARRDALCSRLDGADARACRFGIGVFAN